MQPDNLLYRRNCFEEIASRSILLDVMNQSYIAVLVGFLSAIVNVSIGITKEEKRILYQHGTTYIDI